MLLFNVKTNNLQCNYLAITFQTQYCYSQMSTPSENQHENLIKQDNTISHRAYVVCVYILILLVYILLLFCNSNIIYIAVLGYILIFFLRHNDNG